MPTYPPPVYSHRNATGTGPGAVIDIGTADDEGYPPVLIVNMGAAPITEEIVIGGFSTYFACATGDSWAAVRAQPSADPTIDGEGLVSSTNNENSLWSIGRAAMQFDTSVLSGLTVTGLIVELFVRFVTFDNPKDVTCHIVDKGAIADSYPFPVSDRSLVGSTSFGSIHVVNGEFPDSGAWAQIPMNAGGIAALNLTGDTIFCAREAYDLNNIEPASEPFGVAAHRLAWLFNTLNPTDQPCRLRVTVQSGGSG